MDLQELKKKPHLSASSINDYIDCGLLYKFGRIDRVPREFTADSLEFGTVIHKVLADYYQSRITSTPLTLKEMLGLFDDYWNQTDQRVTDLKYSEGKDFSTYLLDGRELLTAYYEKLPADDFTVLGIEEAFSLNLDGLSIPIIGAIDLIEEDASGTIIISDWKTSGRSYSSDEIDKNFQLTVYNMALLSNGYKGREILSKLDCLIKTKSKKFEQYYTTRSQEEMHRARIKIMRVYEGIKREVFIPNDTSWKCSGCAFKSHCDKWFRGEVQ